MDGLTNNINKLGNAVKPQGTKLDRLGKSMVSVGAVMTATFGAASIGMVKGIGAAVGAAAEFETAWAGVEKTVDGNASQLKALQKELLTVTKAMPQSTKEIFGVAEAAGQLGIERKNIAGFTKTMLDLGVATNMTSEEAATDLARLANITQMPQKNFGRLGATIVDLGNHFATTEKEITSMGLRLAGQGNQVGMSEAQILGLATAMSSVGIEAEAGGTAMSTVMKKIGAAVDNGGSKLSGFAELAGMSAGEFKTAWKKDAAGAIDAVIHGLSKSSKEGENLTEVLGRLGIKGIRESDVLLRLSGNADLLTNALKTANNGWKENTALLNEANKRYGTFDSQVGITKKVMAEFARSIGTPLKDVIGKLLQAINSVVIAVTGFINKFNEAHPTMAKVAAVMALVVAALTGLGAILGVALVAVGGLLSALAPFITSVAKAGGIIKFVLPYVKSLGTIFTVITNPILLVTAAIIAIGAAFVIAYKKVGWFRSAVNSAIAPVIDTFKSFIKIVSNMMERFKNQFGILGNLFKSILPSAGGSFKTMFVDVITQGLKALGQAFNFVVQVISRVIIGILLIVNTVLSKVILFIQKHSEEIKSIVSGVWTVISSLVKGACNILIGIFKILGGILSGDWSKIWEGIKQIVSGVWDAIIGVLKGSVQAWKTILTSTFNAIKSYLSKLWTGIVNDAKGIWNGVTAVWNKVVEGVKKDWTSIKTFFGGLWKSITKGSSGIWDNTVSIWNASIESVKNAWQTVATFLSGLWTSITSRVVSAWNLITGAIMQVVQPFIDIFMNAWAGIATGLTNVFNGVKLVVSGAWEIIKNIILGAVLLIINLVTGNFTELQSNAIQIWNNIKTAALQIWEGMKQVISGIVTVLVSYVSGIFNALKLAVINSWNYLKNAVINIANAIKTGVINAWSALKNSVSNLIKSLVDWAVKSWNNLKNAVINTGNAIKTGAINAWTSLKTGVINIVNAIKNGAIAGWNALKSGVINSINALKNGAVSTWNSLKSSVSTIVTNIKQAAINAWNTLKDKTREIFNKIVEFIKNPLKNVNLFTIGKNIVEGLINGIMSKVNAVKDACKKVSDAITGKIEKILDINSPSRVTYALGQFVGIGLANGIKGTQKQVESVTTSLAKKVSDAIYTGLESKNANSRQVSSVVRTLQNQQTQLNAVVSKRTATANKIATLNKQLQKAPKKQKSGIASQITTAKNQLASYNTQIKTLSNNIAGTQAKLKNLSVDKKAAQQAIGLASIQSFINKQSQKLNAVAKQRDAVIAKLKDANKKLADLVKESQKYAADVANKMKDFASIATIDTSAKDFSANTIQQELQKRLTAIRNFAANIDALRKRGVDKGIIEDILNAGVEDGGAYAKALANADKNTLAAINNTQKQITSASNAMGNAAANAMYGAGINAAKGIIKGLQSQQAALNKSATALGNSIASAVKKALKIHSPSRIMLALGEFVSIGLANGITAQIKAVANATSNMVDAATPDMGAIQTGLKTNMSSDINGAVSASINANTPSTAWQASLGARIDALGDRLDGMAVQIDGKTAGRVMAPRISEQEAQQQRQQFKALGKQY
ncbi:phage tail tape measure protein [Listeria booriae]|nr:phage tail tape measure protein [Listeria booriae]